MPSFAITSAIVAAAVASAVPVQPAVWNFEQDPGGWKVWGTTPELGDTSGVVGLSKREPRTGEQCLCIEDHFTTGNPYAVFVAPVDPNRTYVFSGYVRAEHAGPAGRHVWVMPVNRSGEAEKAIKLGDPDPFGAFRLGETWQRFQFTLPRLDPAVTHLYLAIRPAPAADPKWQGKVWVDGVRFAPQELKALDLASAANAPPDGSGFAVPPGPEWPIAGLTFPLVEPARHQGKSLVSLVPGAGDPAGVALPVGASCDFVYLLHAAVGAVEGAEAGSLVWEYADGSNQSTAVRCGEQVGEGRNGRARDAYREACSPAYPGAPPGCVFVAGLANPAPDREVTRVRLKPAGSGKVRWLVLAALAGTGVNEIELAQVTARDYAAWKPFALGLETAKQPLLDLSFLLDAPAGKHGFVKSRGGHFVFEDGTPARFVAVNIHSHRGLLPSWEEAQRVARTLSRYGVNLVRLHLMEYVLPVPDAFGRSGIAGGKEWERFDNLVKCLKDHGIYVALDSISGLSANRPAPDAFEGAGDYPAHRAWWTYHPTLREQGLAWAKMLLSHRNAQTGNRLVDEPAVAMLMLVNEQSVFFDWREGEKPTPPAIRELFSRRYNEWLVRKFDDRAGLERAWRAADGSSALAAGEDPAKGTVNGWDLYAQVLTHRTATDGDGAIPPARLRTLMQFLQDLQTEAQGDYLALLRSLGVKVPIAGTNIFHEPAELRTCLDMGFTAQNMYYEHVRQANRALMFPNIPEVLCDPLASGNLVHPGIAAAKLNTLPVVSTEHNTMWPQEWRGTHNLSVYSMAAFQDWDALFWYCYMGGYGLSWEDAAKMTAVPYPTVQFNDAATAGLLPAAALLFQRRDVAPGRNLVQVVYDDGMATATGSRMRHGGFPWNYLTWVSRVEGAFGQADGRAQFTVGPQGPRSLPFGAGDWLKSPEEQARVLDGALKQAGLMAPGQGLQGERLVSDTAEVVRDWKRGLLLIDTPRTQAVSGFPAEDVKLRDVTVRSRTPFVTIVVQSLDDAPVAAARKLLLTAVARVENDCDSLSYQRAVRTPNGAIRGEGLTVKPGGKPGRGGFARLEPVEATVSIAGGPLTSIPIAADGSAQGPAFSCDVREGWAEVRLGDSSTVWYLLKRP